MALAFLAGTLPLIDTTHALAHAVLPSLTAHLLRWHHACSEELGFHYSRICEQMNEHNTEMTNTYHKKCHFSNVTISM